MSANVKAKGSSSKKTKNKKEARVFDDKLSEELYGVVEILTHSGKQDLCPEEFKKVKHICRYVF